MGNFELPRLVVRAGLTGHRPDRLLRDEPQLSTELASVLEAMERAATQVAMDHPELYGPSPPIMRLTTGLARGTDEMGADVALHRGWLLQSVLAFERARFVDLATRGCNEAEGTAYRSHFSELLKKSASIFEICGDEVGGLRRDGYELVGEITLEQADVLIGVWDGLPARGLGGSVHLLRVARQRGLPIVWIHATRPQPIKVYLPNHDNEASLDDLEAWLKGSLVLQVTSTPLPATGRNAPQRWKDFIAEDGGRLSRFLPLYQYLLILGGSKKPRWRLSKSESEESWRTNWDAFQETVESVDPEAASSMKEALRLPFKRADHLAELYGRAYRGTYVLIYALAAAATLVGLLGLLFHDAKPLLVVAELLIILVMIGFAVTGRQRNWHERWLEYRAVAEQLRQARMGIWTGQSLEPSDAEGDSSHVGAAWVSWYVRACVRQMPMINAMATPAYTRKAIATINTLEIDDQRRFNNRTAHVQEHVHERLEAIEEKGLLLPLILACTAFLAIYLFDLSQFRRDFDAHMLAANGRWTEHLPELMTFIGALVPALGAALLGVRSQGDFKAYAERTADTAAQLQPITEVAAQWSKQGQAEPGFEDLLELTDRTSEALANDVFAWRLVYRRQVLTVSA